MWLPRLAEWVRCVVRKVRHETSARVYEAPSVEAPRAPAPDPKETQEREVDVVVIGGGLAGLGTATGLAQRQRVVVLEATRPRLDGEDRFDPWMGASYKHVGVSDEPEEPGVRAHFAKRTRDHFRSRGIGVDEDIFEVGREGADVAPVKLSKRTKATRRSGFKAEAESTMKALLEGIDVVFGAGATAITYDDKRWTVECPRLLVKAPKLVVAAGPQSRNILEGLGLTIDTDSVLSVCQAAERQWPAAVVRNAKFCLAGHKDALYLSGARARLPDVYDGIDLDPRQHRRAVRRAVRCARRRVRDLPFKSKPEATWAGVLSVPADAPYPLVGPVRNHKKAFFEDESLLVNTGHGNAGFREAFGAGLVLADMIVDGLGKIATTVTAEGFQRDYAATIPEFGFRVHALPSGTRRRCVSC